ncbi:MAG: type II toxin-antitoxin system CcdA family antitoxin [Rhodospirillales bacterium]|nr:type II toxin-antitoxin system CcdA family antitoxin [Rhodospirillales bacterium]
METPSVKTRRKAVNLTINAAILEEAKALGLNASQAAEKGLISEIKKAKEKQWLKENKKAIEAYNQEIRERGLFFTPSWLNDIDQENFDE